LNINVNKLPKTAKATQNVKIKLLVPVSEYGNIPIKLLINTKLKIEHTFKKSAPFCSISVPRLEIKSGATTSSTNPPSSSSNTYSSAPTSSNNNKAPKNDTIFSSHEIENAICGKLIGSTK
jgi:hypothetical protein